ncbi:MAG: hypothetical protein MUO38_00080, partial [Anaerolineales bacterium]|nr:hypothetical protein [Anaerolineales bacterium]
PGTPAQACPPAVAAPQHLLPPPGGEAVPLPAVPPVIVLVGMLVGQVSNAVGRNRRWAITIGAGAVVAAQALWLLSKVGPFS